MAKKRKTLPKNFDELIKAKNIADLIAVFDSCELNATSGYNKEPALSFFNIPEELTRWLVANGADINAVDITYKRTPLHHHAMRRSGDVALLLELGANIDVKDTYGDTPLHMAAGSAFSLKNVQALIEKGADTTIKNAAGETPLTHALKRANNIDIIALANISDILFQNGPVVPQMQQAVLSIGGNFEFHRENFNKEYLPATDIALHQLYKKFNVPPVNKRQLHDSVSPILITADKWEDQYCELWDLLIPSSGPAKTVQGEVIRITGRVRDEIYRNGGGNWNINFKKMLDALIIYLGSGVTLDETLFDEATIIAKKVRRLENVDNEPTRLCELATAWVIANPNPIPLNRTDYEI